MSTGDLIRTDKPCKTCEHFGRYAVEGWADGPVVCGLDGHVTGTPSHGCCSWQRAVGADDEDPPAQ